MAEYRANPAQVPHEYAGGSSDAVIAGETTSPIGWLCGRDLPVESNRNIAARVARRGKWTRTVSVGMDTSELRSGH